MVVFGYALDDGVLLPELVDGLLESREYGDELIQDIVLKDDTGPATPALLRSDRAFLKVEVRGYAGRNQEEVSCLYFYLPLFGGEQSGS